MILLAVYCRRGLVLIHCNTVLLGQESYNISEITNRLTAGEADDDCVDDGDEDEDGDEIDTGPSLAKSARIVPNPEEIKLDDDYNTSSIGGYDPESVYVSGTLPVNDNEYNPEPVIKNPDVIDIDDLDIDDNDDEKVNVEDSKVSEDKEPEEYEPGDVDLEVTYNPQPVIEGNSMEGNSLSKEIV